MHRTGLLDQLDQYQLTSPAESPVCARVVSFIKEHENCFERTLTSGHITASAWLIDPAGSKVALTHHAKLNRWVQLGGHCDGDPDVLRVALREAEEESGLKGIVPVNNEIFDIDIHEIPAHGSVAAHLHYDIRFLLQSPVEREFKISHESKDLGWFDWDDLNKISDEESLRRMALKWRALNLF